MHHYNNNSSAQLPTSRLGQSSVVVPILIIIAISVVIALVTYVNVGLLTSPNNDSAYPSESITADASQSQTVKNNSITNNQASEVAIAPHQPREVKIPSDSITTTQQSIDHTPNTRVEASPLVRTPKGEDTLINSWIKYLPIRL